MKMRLNIKVRPQGQYARLRVQGPARAKCILLAVVVKAR